MKKYDIFISYRREGGYDTAKHINDLLTRDGYKVSFDIDTLRNGNFDTQLLTRIEQCKDFILIVDKHCFDRTLDKDIDPSKDWVRCELAHALKINKNIIPVFLAGVSGFPEGLPEDISEVSKKNGPEYNRYYFDDFYHKLCSRFLSAWSLKKKIIFAAIPFLLIIGIMLIAFTKNSPEEIRYVDPMIPQTTNEQELKEYAQNHISSAIDNLKLENETAANKYWQAQEDMEGMSNQGLCHLIGAGCSPNLNKAIKCLSKAAKEGSAVAQYAIAVCYDQGIGVKQDIEQATKWYKEAAEQGVIEAQCDYGIACTLKNNFIEAITWLEKAAERGYAKAQYTLGWNYSNYNKIEEALLWMEEAADQDYIPALMALGNAYLQGPSYIQDYETAIEILDYLASQNNAMAQYAMAICYAQGKGVDTNIEIAMEYLNKSAEQEYAVALTELAGVYCSGAATITQDFHKAMELYKKAANQGYPLAQIAIGRMYENGWGTKKSINIAMKWYRKAEKQGINLQYLQQMQQIQQLQQQGNANTIHQ